MRISNETLQEMMDNATREHATDGFVYDLMADLLEARRLAVRLTAEIQSLKAEPEGVGFQFTQLERQLMRERDKVGAIKSIRERLSVDLITAKRLVDKWSGR